MEPDLIGRTLDSLGRFGAAVTDVDVTLQGHGSQLRSELHALERPKHDVIEDYLDEAEMSAQRVLRWIDRMRAVSREERTR